MTSIANIARHEAISAFLIALFEPQRVSAHVAASRAAAPAEIQILQVPPGETCGHFVYVTCGLSGRERAELVVCAAAEEPRLLRTLFAGIRRQSAAALAAGDVFPIGEPCLPESPCDHVVAAPTAWCGFDFGQVRTGEGTAAFLWLLPITAEEAVYREQHGIDALAGLFQTAGLDVVNFHRPSLAAGTNGC